jgi:hypothetical protein
VAIGSHVVRETELLKANDAPRLRLAHGLGAELREQAS